MSTIQSTNRITSDRVKVWTSTKFLLHSNAANGKLKIYLTIRLITIISSLAYKTLLKTYLKVAKKSTYIKTPSKNLNHLPKTDEIYVFQMIVE